jgi:hypothetical protein
MVITILTSIKVYIKNTEYSSQEQDLGVQYKSIALDLFKVLSLPKENRESD